MARSCSGMSVSRKYPGVHALFTPSSWAFLYPRRSHSTRRGRISNQSNRRSWINDGFEELSV
ncbi:hypothetical protein B0H10DRAFT_1984254 [Mycena sp. CBHHK59/15]|nr:hypothetical protein B0H10DRAFT_1984254 [Mycena sp. CBHHK59/15]